MTCFPKIEAYMGVIYFLIWVRKYESNLPTNICATAGKETQWQREKCGLLSEIIFLPDFIIAWCVFFYQIVYFFTNGVYHYFHHHITFLWFLENSVGKKYTPCGGVVWFPLPNAIFFTLAFKWCFTYTIEAPLSLGTSCKKSQGRCPRAPAGAYAPRTLRTRVMKKWPPSKLCVIPQKRYEFTLAFLICLI